MRFENQKEIIRHQIDRHPESKLAIIVENKTRIFNIKGQDVKCDIDSVSFDPRTGKLQLPTRNEIESPIHKIKKINTPTKHVHKQLFPDIVEDTSESFATNTDDLDEASGQENYILDYSETDMGNDLPVTVEPERLTIIVQRLKELLPSVTKHFLDKDRIEEWISFFRQVDNGDIEVDHIASQLFWDVVKYNDMKTVHSMRFTSDVKEFWAVGMSLFHAKFIRFMGGLKAQGTVGEKAESKSMRPDVSKINFVCPDIKLLVEEKKQHKIECEKPGIVSSNIEAVANLPESKDKCFKICIDGKKISAGFGKVLGEVDLFGHETPETLSEKQERLNVELNLIDDTRSLIEREIEIDKETVDSMVEDQKQDLRYKMIDLISVLTERVRELRMLRVKRVLAIEKFVKLADEPWQKSKYSYVISSMKTQLLRVNMCIDEALQTIDRLGLIAAACNNSLALYSLDKTVTLDQQSNYVCLNEMPSDHNSQLPSHLIKQRSDKWFEIRKKAKVTGSTMHRAVGLSTLKEQQQHFENVTSLTEQPKKVTEDQNQAMMHGVKNEINAVGVAVSKVLPIYAPMTSFFEEGCYCLENGKLVVSPDGSCRKPDGTPSLAIEIKCPVPGKKYTPDVHYTIPVYYVCQILSEMKALDCQSLLYICWTPQSCTVMRAKFDEVLWKNLLEEIDAIFPLEGEPMKPKRKRESVAVLKDMIKTYTEQSIELLAEFPSANSNVCSHSGSSCTDETVRGYHNIHENTNSSVKQNYIKLPEIGQIVMRAGKCIEEMYNVLRTPAKEVLVAVLSDMDRIKRTEQTHAIPIAYGLSGYSLKVEVVRSMLDEVTSACRKMGLNVVALSSDGQFYRLAVRNKKDEPLTILQLAKDTWLKAKRMTKIEEVNALMEVNRVTNIAEVYHTVTQQRNQDGNIVYYGPIHVNGIVDQQWKQLYNPPRLRKLISQRGNKDKNNESMENDLDDLPPDVLNKLPDEDIDYISGDSADVTTESMNTSHMSKTTENDAETIHESMNDDEDVETVIDENIVTEQISYMDIVAALKEIDKQRKKPKWSSLTIDTLNCLLREKPEVLKSKLSKKELFACALQSRAEIEAQTGMCIDKMTKLQLVNALSARAGHTEVLAPKRTPKTLRSLLKDVLSRIFGKEALNAVIATDMFLQIALPAWRANATYQDGVTVGKASEPFVWYSQPEICTSSGQCMFYLLDCHHLFVNARCFVVQNGISGLNVNKQAWRSVAEQNSETNVGLNIAMVHDVIDKQSNEIAQLTFSEKVEAQMRRTGWDNEAQFCKIMREWYMAEDEPGLDVMQRYQMRMALRHVLLNSVNFAEFPPAGSHVSGMPVVMFEGILTNIDRRIQLYSVTPDNMYNVRAPTSLDAENLFGQFRDLDPKSTGALMADDIPTALETASYVLQMRLNPDRKYVMHTAKSSRMYPENALHDTDGDHQVEQRGQRDTSRASLIKMGVLEMRNHAFDVRDKRSRKPNRKSVLVPSVDQPARGTRPVRQHHRVDSSKILPHVRYGLTDI